MKATALGIKAVDYEKQKVNIDKLYSGFTEQDATADTVAEHLPQRSDPLERPAAAQPLLLLHDRVHNESVSGRYTSSGSLVSSTTRCHRLPGCVR